MKKFRGSRISWVLFIGVSMAGLIYCLNEFGYLGIDPLHAPTYVVAPLGVLFFWCFVLLDYHAGKQVEKWRNCYTPKSAERYARIAQYDWWEDFSITVAATPSFLTIAGHEKL